MYCFLESGILALTGAVTLTYGIVQGLVAI
jgi:hypothetical protein